MMLNEFARLTDLINKTELQKVQFLAFYFLEVDSMEEFTLKEIKDIFISLGFAQPNVSRLKEKIQKSPSILKGKSKNHFRLSAKQLKCLQEKYPNLSESETIESNNSLLPEALLHDTKRPYLLKLALQINAAYEQNLFDACALLMRRLLEILVIHCFEAKGIEAQIKDSDGDFNKLKTLINKATSSADIGLSNDVKQEIDQFRELGNLSAHRVKYSCRKQDINQRKLAYRAVIEELLYTANLVPMPEVKTLLS